MVATWITLLRFPLLMAVVPMLYADAPAVRLLGAGGLLAGLFLDTLDGLVARRRQETSLLGSVLDIAADRTYEIVLWLCFLDRGLVPLIIPIIVTVRTALTDAIRSVGVQAGAAPFEQSRSRTARFLVASSSMRTGYGLSKVLAFGGLALVNAGGVEGELPLSVRAAMWGCVGLCVLRGVPVLVEGVGRVGWRKNASGMATPR